MDWKTPYCKDDNSAQIGHRLRAISMTTPATIFRNDESTLKFIWKGKVPGVDTLVLQRTKSEELYCFLLELTIKLINQKRIIIQINGIIMTNLEIEPHRVN